MIYQYKFGVLNSLSLIDMKGIDVNCRMFTEAPDLIPLFKFAKNKTPKQLETSPRLAIHASNVMNVVGQVN